MMGVVLARILTPHDFGVFGYAASLVVIAFIPANWNLSQMLVPDGGKTRSLYFECLGFAWGIVAAKFLLLCGLTAYLWFRGDREAAAIAALFGYPTLFNDIVNVQRAVCEGRGQFKINFYNAVLTILVALGFGAPLALMGFGPYALVLPTPVLIIGQLILYGRATGLPVFSLREMRFPLQYFGRGFQMWLISSCEQALSRVDKVIVASFSGEAALGNYSRAFNYAPMSHQLLNSLLTNPTVSALARQQDRGRRIGIIWKTAALVIGSGAINWLLVLLLSRPLVPLVFGPQWVSSIPFFEAFGGLSLAYAVSGLPMTILLSQRRYGMIAGIRLLFTCLILGGFYLAFARGHYLLGPHILVYGLIAQGVVMFPFAYRGLFRI